MNCKNAQHLHERGQVDPGHIKEFGCEGYCENCLKVWEKVQLIQKHIDAERAKSPDGMTAWDRVEKYRLEHGHLPSQDGHPQAGCEACVKELGKLKRVFVKTPGGEEHELHQNLDIGISVKADCPRHGEVFDGLEEHAPDSCPSCGAKLEKRK